eukprot:TRINITY_DN9274_c0_g1_i1.p1 TRINITY_DN9274_c0_g1~~TRINITY_DN9274_c0_g1_i1.p1  ORF type:complete len:109 (+),score=10.94 TRINITY_DN9274_c0_g1_i1:58-384(+)
MKLMGVPLTTAGPTIDTMSDDYHRMKRELDAQRAEIFMLREAFVDVLEAEEVRQRSASLNGIQGTISNAERMRIRTCKKQLWNQLIFITKHRRQGTAAHSNAATTARN